MTWLIDLINKNLGVVTLVAAFFAIYIYFKQKKDRKRDAARLILQEIRYAEHQIRNSGRGERGYSLASRLLPTNSWNDNIHLFTRDLKETEIDMISEFFSKATYIDFLITERSHQKLNQKFSMRSAPSVLSQNISITASPIPVNNFPEIPAASTPNKIQITRIPNPNEQIAVDLLNDISSSIEFLYNTPAAEKLRKISDKRWFHLF